MAAAANELSVILPTCDTACTDWPIPIANGSLLGTPIVVSAVWVRDTTIVANPESARGFSPVGAAFTVAESLATGFTLAESLATAVMVAVPAETPVMRPLASTVATFGFDELQTTSSRHPNARVTLSSLNDANIAKSESNLVPSRDTNL
jgi:hypothetical protein